MQRLIWIGNPYFATLMEDLGWTVHVRPMDSFTWRMLSWEELVDDAGFEPDAVVYGDASLAPMLRGVADFPCLTVFHCVDSHLHQWYRSFSQAFDLCTVAMRDHLPEFVGPRLGPDQVRWMPLYSRDTDRPLQRDREWNVVFCGKVDPELTPARHDFLAKLGRVVPKVLLARGDYREFFAMGRVAVNVAEHNDLNFRVFEALGCRACLVTPRVGHGQGELFRDGVDLLTYEPGDLESAVEAIGRVLADPRAAQRMASSGYRAVNAGHKARHRAEELDAWMRAAPAAELVAARREQARLIHFAHLEMLYLHWGGNSPRHDVKRYCLEAARQWRAA